MSDEETKLAIEIGFSLKPEAVTNLRKNVHSLKKEIETETGKGLSGLFGHEASSPGGSFSGALKGAKPTGDLLKALKGNEKLLGDVLTTLKDDIASNNRAKGEGKKKPSGAAATGADISTAPGAPSSSNSKVFPFVQNLFDSTLFSNAIGGIGAAINTALKKGAPGSAAAGFEVGSAVSNVIKQIDGVLEAGQEGLLNRLKEDLHFREIFEQTGTAAEDLYKLSQQADLVSGSFEDLLRTNKTFSDKLVGGFSSGETQLLMALNINPTDLFRKSGQDSAKFTQSLFEATEKALANKPAARRASIEELLGFSGAEQTTRRHLNDKGIPEAVEDLFKIATSGGKQPFETPERVQNRFTELEKVNLSKDAAKRSVFTGDSAVTNISAGYVKLKAKAVHLIIDGINWISKSSPEELPVTPPSRKRKKPSSGAPAKSVGQ